MTERDDTALDNLLNQDCGSPTCQAMVEGLTQMNTRQTEIIERLENQVHDLSVFEAEVRVLKRERDELLARVAEMDSKERLASKGWSVLW